MSVERTLLAYHIILASAASEAVAGYADPTNGPLRYMRVQVFRTPCVAKAHSASLAYCAPHSCHPSRAYTNRQLVSSPTRHLTQKQLGKQDVHTCCSRGPPHSTHRRLSPELATRASTPHIPAPWFPSGFLGRHLQLAVQDHIRSCCCCRRPICRR